MTHLEIACVKLYEAGVSIDDIAETQDLDTAAVKVALSQNSERYREDAKTNGDVAFTLTEREQARKVFVELMNFSSDEHIRLKCARYIRDDSEGRLDTMPQTIKKMKGTVTIVQFNERMAKALEATSRARVVTNGTPQRSLQEFCIKQSSVEVEAEAEVVGK